MITLNFSAGTIFALGVVVGITVAVVGIIAVALLYNRKSNKR